MTRTRWLVTLLISALLLTGCNAGTSTKSDTPAPPPGPQKVTQVNEADDTTNIYRVVGDYLSALSSGDYDGAFKLLSDEGRIGVDPQDLATPRVAAAKVISIGISHADRRGATLDVVVKAEMQVEGEGLYKNGENKLYVTLTNWSDRGWLIDKIANE